MRKRLYLAPPLARLLNRLAFYKPCVLRMRKQLYLAPPLARLLNILACYKPCVLRMRKQLYLAPPLARLLNRLACYKPCVLRMRKILYLAPPLARLLNRLASYKPCVLRMRKLLYLAPTLAIGCWSDWPATSHACCACGTTFNLAPPLARMPIIRFKPKAKCTAHATQGYLPGATAGQDSDHEGQPKAEWDAEEAAKYRLLQLVTQDHLPVNSSNFVIILCLKN